MLELAETMRLALSPVPALMPLSPTVWSGALMANVTFESALSVGTSLTGFTVSRNVVLLLLPLASLTQSVINDAPEALATGVSATVRSAPALPRITFAFGSSTRFEEVALMVRLAAAVSTSPTVKDNGPVPVSSLMERLGMPLIVGTSFTLVTVSTKLELAERPESELAVRVTVALPL